MVSMAMHCGTSLVPLWSHNFSMPALHGGDILKPMKETVHRIQGYKIRFSPALLLHSWRIKWGCRWKLFYSSRYNPNHVLHRLLPNPKEMITICSNVSTTLLYLRTATLLWNRILFIEWFFKDIYWFLSNVQCYFTKTLLFRDIYCIVTSSSIHLYHVRLSCVIKGFSYLLSCCCCCCCCYW